MKQKFLEIPEYTYGDFCVLHHKISFIDWNENATEVVLCVHALISNSRDFDYIALDLAKNFRVIAIDIPGRGDSDKFQDPDLYQYPIYITDILYLLDHLSISKVHWIGTSMGGIAGMYFATHYPHRLCSLVLNDIGPEIPWRAFFKIRKYIANIPYLENYEAAKKHFKLLYKNFGIKDEEHWDHLVIHSTFIKDDGSYGLKYDPAISKSNIKNYEQDIEFWDFWQDIKCHILLVMLLH
jgi:pimeloyl-ACP methyl ester carboxylesterase